jgi:hypothetical protein
MLASKPRLLVCLAWTLMVAAMWPPGTVAAQVADVPEQTSCKTADAWETAKLLSPGDQSAQAPRTVVFAPDGNIEVAARLLGDDIALGWRYTASADRGRHDRWRYRIFVTNLAQDSNGNPFPVGRCGFAGHELLLQKASPLILFNLVAVVEWDARPEYLNDLAQAFRAASDYLYDLTDGQMTIGQVTIVDNELYTLESDSWWQSANLRFNASNTICPAHLPPNVSGTRDAITLPPFWTRYGTSPGNWSGSDGNRTLVHELGHHVLGVYDEYITDHLYCTDLDLRHPADSGGDEQRASAMAYQFEATEFSARPPLDPQGNPITPWKLWSEECEKTPHFKETKQSIWETIDSGFSDDATPARWEIVTPTERGHVMIGPSTKPRAFPWPHITLLPFVSPGCGADEARCSPLRKVCVRDGQQLSAYPDQITARLARSEKVSIDLGVLDKDYCIDVVEAGLGTKLILTSGWEERIVVIDESTESTALLSAQDTPPPMAGGFLVQPARLLPGDSTAGIAWATEFLRSVQDASAVCPQWAATSYYEPLQELAADLDGTATLLAQQSWFQTERVLPPDWVRPQLEPWDPGDRWPQPDITWLQHALPVEEDDTRWQQLLRGIPALRQAYQRQSNFTCQTIESMTENFLATPDRLWLAQVPPQPDAIEVALESWQPSPGGASFDTAQALQVLRISASGPFTEPIVISYTATCRPGGSPPNLALRNKETGQMVQAEFSPVGFPKKFLITEPGDYELIAWENW